MVSNHPQDSWTLITLYFVGSHPAHTDDGDAVVYIGSVTMIKLPQTCFVVFDLTEDVHALLLSSQWFEGGSSDGRHHVFSSAAATHCNYQHQAITRCSPGLLWHLLPRLAPLSITVILFKPFRQIKQWLSFIIILVKSCFLLWLMLYTQRPVFHKDHC